ncbi:MAG TPA: protein kinase [Jiangellales bacterium]|nr:protein kinase [Jiangellales bacterium]
MGFTAGQGARTDRIGDRYRLVARLGRGGMGSVWQAFDERLQRTVAVKILDPAQSDVDQGRVEAVALAQLNHPSIANVFDYGEDGGRPYVVMELVPGRSLAAIMADTSLMSWSAATAAAAHVASALAAAHERGVVHRDVKPGNIMVTSDGAKLIDFGISAVEGEAETDASGGFRGTPVYVAPERLRGHAVAAPADVYALGVVLYRALSGHLPWRTGGTGEYLTEREHIDPAPLPLTGGLPSDVSDLCLQCLAADPTQRPDAATVARVLTKAAGPDGVRELELLAATRDGTDEATQLMAQVSIGDSRSGLRAATAKAGTVAAVVAAVLALAWSTAQWSPVSGNNIPETINAADPPAPQQPACAVTFRLAADDGERFAADIVATPRTESFRPGWRLSLPLPADGVDVDTSGWTRSGGTLTSPAQPTLGVGRPSQLELSGSHSGAISLPTSMSVDGRDCAIDLIASSTAAQPAAPETSGRPALSTPPPAERGNGPKPGNGTTQGANGTEQGNGPMPGNGAENGQGDDGD